MKKHHLLLLVFMLCMNAVNLYSQDDSSLGIDMTEKIVNGGFDDQYEGWTIDAPGQKISTTEKAGGLIPGGQNHLQLWVGSGGINGKVYQQLSNLPNGIYTVTAIIVSSNFEGTISLYANEAKSPITPGDNKKYQATTIVSDGIMEIGIELATTGSPTIDMDDFRLYFSSDDETEIIEMLKNNLQSMIDETQSLIDEEFADYLGMQAEFGDMLMNYDAYDITDKETGYKMIEAVKEIQDKMNIALKNAENLKETIRKAETLINSTTIYPGIDALVETYEIIVEFYDGQEGTSDEYAMYLEKLNNAIEAYSMSQDATLDKPADYTYMIKHPQFCIPEAEGIMQEDSTMLYPYGENYVNGKVPAEATSEGWYTGNEGGDQKLSFSQQRICWNAWNNNFDYMSINQDLTGLPNGYYSISADFITHPGCATTQHTFAETNALKVTSDTLKEGLSILQEPYNGRWQTLKTDLIIVTDGKMTIGAETTGDKVNTPADFGGTATDHSRGWFLVSNFKLYYHGPASAEDVKNILAGKLSECQAQCDTMMFRYDKKTYQDSIDKCRNASTSDEINSALNILSDAQKEAEKSISKQTEIAAGVYASMADSIAEGSYTGEIASAAHKLHDCMSMEIESEYATYTEMDSLVSILDAFVSKYIPAYRTAASMNVSDEKCRTNLHANMDRQISEYENLTSLPEITLVEKHVEQLYKAIKQCEAMDLYLSGTDDYTSLISNPDIENSSSGSAEGWTITVTGGNYVTASGQQVDGASGGRYLDSYNGTAGNLLYNAYQTIENLPSGIYKVRAMMRTSSDEGVYLYAIADNDSATATLAEVSRERINITHYGGPKAQDGLDSIATVAGQYGSIWCDLYDRTQGGATADVAEADTLNANSARGYGWQYKEVEIEVTGHTLTIGATCDSTFTKNHGGRAFTGQWFSADNFTLTLVKEGSNDNWNPSTGISSVGETKGDELVVKVHDGTITTNGDIYSLNGTRIANGSKVAKGVYIIRHKENSKKIFVR